MDRAELPAWIAQATGAAPGQLEPVGYGASRATYLVEADGKSLVVRHDTGDGPMADTPLTLGREAQIYRALRDTAVRIPRLHAVADDGSALLVERVPGTHEFDGVEEASRQAVNNDYIHALAELHTVDATRLDLPGFARPDDAASHALYELDLWGGILDSVATRPWPLADFTRIVLRDLAPTFVARTVLCHGDVGPGNFLHEHGRVTALLDWEFGHLGDPMDDLAWWVFRGHDIKGGCGDLEQQLDLWSSRTGLPVLGDSIEYYRAMVMFRWLVSAISVLERGGAGIDRAVHFTLIPVLTTRLPQSLAALLGVALDKPCPVPEPDTSPSEAAIDALDEDLRHVVAPSVTSAEAARRLASAQVYLSHLRASARLGPGLDAAGLDDVSNLLQRRFGSLEEAEHALVGHVSSPDADWADLVQHFWRSGHRLVSLWPASAHRALGRPTAIPA